MDSIETVLSVIDLRIQALGALLEDEAFRRSVSSVHASQLQAIATQYDQLRGAIYDEVVASYREVNRQAAANLYREPVQSFTKWFQDIPNIRPVVPIFTTNYDVAVEVASGILGGRLCDNFRPTSTGTVWDPRALESFVEDPDLLSVILIKLHGSVDWGIRQTDYGARLAKIPYDTSRDPGGYAHTLHYPTLGRKQVDQDPYRTSYDCLRQCLRSAKLLVAIGTSFRDPELNEELRRGLDDNSALHLVAVSPNADYLDVATRIGAEASGGRVVAFRGKFGDDRFTPLNALLMSNLRELARIASGVQQTASSFCFGATFDFPIKAPTIPPPLTPRFQL